MTTYYNGYDILWLDDGTFKIMDKRRVKRFPTLRKVMDYVDAKRARGTGNLGNSSFNSRSGSVVDE